MKILFSVIREAGLKRPGLANAFYSAGKPAGMHLEISREAFDAIQAQYFPGGVGTALHNILAPGIELIDSILGTNLGNCGGCAGRELGLNSLLFESAHDEQQQADNEQAPTNGVSGV